MAEINLTKHIESTLLKPECTLAQVSALCLEALELGFIGVCVHPRFLVHCRSILGKAPVELVTVVGFPLGANAIRIKAAETAAAVADGASELDMVLAIGALKDRDYSYVEKDIAAVVKEAGGKPVKVIIETALLSQEEKVTAAKIAVQAGARFVKTSTGFAGGGATVEDIKLLRNTVPSEVLIKASGGIKDRPFALELVKAGAARIGTSSGRAIA